MLLYLNHSEKLHPFWTKMVLSGWTDACFMPAYPLELNTLFFSPKPIEFHSKIFMLDLIQFCIYFDNSSGSSQVVELSSLFYQNAFVVFILAKIVYSLYDNLPSFRFCQLKCFSHVTLHYAGPISISLRRHRGFKLSKAYVCIFVCCAVKAVHIELVSDLSFEAFIAVDVVVTFTVTAEPLSLALVINCKNFGNKRPNN